MKINTSVIGVTTTSTHEVISQLVTLCPSITSTNQSLTTRGTLVMPIHTASARRTATYYTQKLVWRGRKQSIGSSTSIHPQMISIREVLDHEFHEVRGCSCLL